ncbi:hypothetical protein SAMN05216559_1545 [Halomicrobium zhouii]|uniref:Uncharacterized protein n=1 Tax=Halomicrobium zhouii TaxID=767519 RepID=A0A1I6KTE5_9EURY|nr:hypothetical protein [Halomicrobium zhouii]SFR94523.1 hypothetical protein SAMN05216559_1545 [Halomicrobium zhouii]
MPRLVQVATFFVLFGAGYVALAPFPHDGAVLGFVLSWSIVLATLTHVVPWLYFKLDTEPVAPSKDS